MDIDSPFPARSIAPPSATMKPLSGQNDTPVMPAATEPTPPASFADALREVERSGLPAAQVAGFRREVRLLAKLTGKAPEDLPLEPVRLRPILAGVVPGTSGTTQKRWSRLLGRITRLSSLVGAIETAPAGIAELSASWRALLDAIPDDRSSRPRRCCLAAFARFCAAGGVEPEGVTADHLEDYRAWRADNSYLADLATHVNAIRRAFNLAVERGADPRLQELVAPRDPRVRAMSVGDFPVPFGTALTAYLDALRHPDPFDTRAGRPLAQTTVNSQRQIVLASASVLVRKGMAVEDFTSLAPLATEPAMRTVLLDIHERSGKRWTQSAKVTAATLVSIGRRAIRLDEAALSRLLALQAMVKTGRTTMGRRSRERLGQFDDESVLTALYELPAKLYAIAATRRREGALKRAAEIHERALALHVTLVQPVRVANLCRLDLDRHFRRDGRGRITGLAIPAEETKSGIEIRTALPREMGTALERHLRDYRPHLLEKVETTSLFPGRAGGPTRAPSVLAKGIKATVGRYLGIAYNTHLARHLAATLLFDADPGNGPVAQRLLGHSSLKTTERIYGFVRTRGAQAIYAQLLEDKLARRGAGGPRRKGGSR